MGRLASGRPRDDERLRQRDPVVPLGHPGVHDRAILRTGIWGETLEIQRSGPRPSRRSGRSPGCRSGSSSSTSASGRIPNPSPPEVGLRMARLWDAIRESPRPRRRRRAPAGRRGRLAAPARVTAAMTRVTVWSEHRQERSDPAGRGDLPRRDPRGDRRRAARRRLRRPDRHARRAGARPDRCGPRGDRRPDLVGPRRPRRGGRRDRRPGPAAGARRDGPDRPPLRPPLEDLPAADGHDLPT